MVATVESCKVCSVNDTDVPNRQTRHEAAAEHCAFLPHLQAHVASSTGLVGPCICGLFCLHRPLWPPSLTALTPVTELPQNKTSQLSEFPFYSSSSLAVLRTQYVHIRHKMEHIYLHCACGCFRGHVHTHLWNSVSSQGCALCSGLTFCTL